MTLKPCIMTSRPYHDLETLYYDLETVYHDFEPVYHDMPSCNIRSRVPPSTNSQLGTGRITLQTSDWGVGLDVGLTSHLSVALWVINGIDLQGGRKNQISEHFPTYRVAENKAVCWNGAFTQYHTLKLNHVVSNHIESTYVYAGTWHIQQSLCQPNRYPVHK